jgi:type I restriction enzyme S subunit
MSELAKTPIGWEVQRLGDFVIYQKGKKPKVINKIQSKDCSLPYVNIKAFEKNIIDEFTDGIGCVLCEDGDFLMVWDGARSGYIGKAIKGALGSTLVKITFPGINLDYAYYYLLSKYLQINTKAKGTGIPHVDPGLLWNYRFPLPPLPEQLRIVAKIEELFSDLDKGIESLKTARGQLKTYRQAVLKYAFEGKLTNKNVKDGELPEGWRYKRLGNLIKNIEAGKSFKCDERPPGSDETGILKVSAVTWGRFNEDESKTVIDMEKIKSQYLVHVGDFLFSRANTLELVGAVVKVHAISKTLLLSDKTLRLRFDESLLDDNYSLYFLKSQSGRRQIQKNSSGNQESMRNIGQEGIRRIEIPLPFSRTEQLLVVSEIESRLSVCDKMEESITQSLVQAEALRQSILKKAFEGRLVPQDPNDLPASVLLERIRAEREKNNAMKAAKPRRAGMK